MIWKVPRVKSSDEDNPRVIMLDPYAVRAAHSTYSLWDRWDRWDLWDLWDVLSLRAFNPLFSDGASLSS